MVIMTMLLQHLYVHLGKIQTRTNQSNILEKLFYIFIGLSELQLQLTENLSEVQIILSLITIIMTILSNCK